MSFREIILHSFGAFEEERFRFDAPTGLFYITGDNEAGKSTLFSAMKTILAGFRPASKERFAYFPIGKKEASLEAVLWDGSRVTRQLSFSPSGYLITENETKALGNLPMPPLKVAMVDQLYSLGPTAADALEEKDFMELVEEFLWPSQKNIRSLKEARAISSSKRRELYVHRKDGRGQLNALQREIERLDQLLIDSRERDLHTWEDRVESLRLEEEMQEIDLQIQQLQEKREEQLKDHIALSENDVRIMKQRWKIKEQLEQIEEEIRLSGGQKMDPAFSPDALADLSVLSPVFLLISIILFAISLVTVFLYRWWAIIPFVGAMLFLALFWMSQRKRGLRGVLSPKQTRLLKELGAQWYDLYRSLPAEPHVERRVLSKIPEPSEKTLEAFYTQQQDVQRTMEAQREEMEEASHKRDDILWSLSAIRERQVRFEMELSTAELEDAREEKIQEAKQLDIEWAGWAMAEELLEHLMDSKLRSLSELLPRASEYMKRFSAGKWRQIHRSGNGFLLEDDRGVMVRSTHQLSRGTADQFLLSLRLAMLDTLETTQRPFPLLLDEALAHWDEDRHGIAMQVLSEIASQRAVYFFTTQSDTERWKDLENINFIRLEKQ